MVQLMPNSYQEIEVLMDFEAEEIVTLGELNHQYISNLRLYYMEGQYKSSVFFPNMFAQAHAEEICH